MLPFVRPLTPSPCPPWSCPAVNRHPISPAPGLLPRLSLPRWLQDEVELFARHGLAPHAQQHLSLLLPLAPQYWAAARLGYSTAAAAMATTATAFTIRDAIAASGAGRQLPQLLPDVAPAGELRVAGLSQSMLYLLSYRRKAAQARRRLQEHGAQGQQGQGQGDVQAQGVQGHVMQGHVVEGIQGAGHDADSDSEEGGAADAADGDEEEEEEEQEGQAEGAGGGQGHGEVVDDLGLGLFRAEEGGQQAQAPLEGGDAHPGEPHLHQHQQQVTDEPEMQVSHHGSPAPSSPLLPSPSPAASLAPSSPSASSSASGVLSEADIQSSGSDGLLLPDAEHQEPNFDRSAASSDRVASEAAAWSSLERGALYRWGLRGAVE